MSDLRPQVTRFRKLTEADREFLLEARAEFRSRTTQRGRGPEREVPVIVWNDGRPGIDCIDLAIAIHDKIEDLFDKKLEPALLSDPSLRSDIIGLGEPSAENGGWIPLGNPILMGRAIEAVLPKHGKSRDVVRNTLLANAPKPELVAVEEEILPEAAVVIQSDEPDIKVETDFRDELDDIASQLNYLTAEIFGLKSAYEELRALMDATRLKNLIVAAIDEWRRANKTAQTTNGSDATRDDHPTA